MPTVVRVDGMSFVIHPNDHPPPHTHVKLDGGREYRINLLSRDFMDAQPKGKKRRKIMKVYDENLEKIWSAWEKYHSDDP